MKKYMWSSLNAMGLNMFKTIENVLKKRRKNWKMNLSKNCGRRENFERFMALSEKYKSSWFWGDNGNASCRAYKERRDSMSYETVVNGDAYSVDFSVSMSRNHVYVNKVVTKNGVKTNSHVPLFHSCYVYKKHFLSLVLTYG